MRLCFAVDVDFIILYMYLFIYFSILNLGVFDKTKDRGEQIHFGSVSSTDF